MRNKSSAIITQTHFQSRAERPPFHLSPIAALIAGIAVTLANPGFAADAQSTDPLATAVAPNAKNKAADSSEPTLLDAVVVRTRKKNDLEVLKEVPKSISVVSGEELEKTGSLNVTDILKKIGNVKWNYGNPKTGSLSIRGISAGSSEAIDPSLGVNVDGVPYAYVALASAADYVDLDTIDVARGPQGSTGGKNTSMGTINVKSKRPSFTSEANASITFGQLNALVTQAAVGGSVVDNLVAWRGTFYRNQQDGAYQNAYGDIERRNSYVNTDRTYGRAQFLITPTDSFSAIVRVENKPTGIEFVNGLTIKNPEPATYSNGAPVYIANGTLNAANTASTATNLTQNKLARSWFTPAGYTYNNYINQPVNEDQNKGILNGSNGRSAELNWDLKNHKLTSITAYKDNYFQASNDEGTPFDITKNSGLFVDYSQTSQELKLSSNPGDRVDYQIGAFALTNQSLAHSRTRYGSDAGAWFANDTQYSGTYTAGVANRNGLGSTAAGKLLLKDSLDRVYTQTSTWTDNKSAAIFGQADWHVNEPLTLTFGLRVNNENRSTQQSKTTDDNGYGALLNPVAQGGFNTSATGALAATNTAAQTANANLVASQYFGKATYSLLTAVEKQQVAYAKAIRAAQGYATLYDKTQAEKYQGNLPTGNISLNYKINEDLNSYLSLQHGAKAGISQISGVDTAKNPISRLVDAEQSDIVELGVKTSLLERTLVINADVFYDRLKNYQQTVTILDPILTAQSGTNTYTSITGNAPRVNIKGLEVDATYSGITYTTLRFAGAYNDARYGESILVATPSELGNVSSYVDANGQLVANSSKISFNLSADFRRPAFDNKEFHTNLNYNYTGAQNSSAAPSSLYTQVDAYSLVDLSVGIGRKDQRFDTNFIVKNLLDTKYKTNTTWNSYVPNNPRWVGVVFSSKL